MLIRHISEGALLVAVYLLVGVHLTKSMNIMLSRGRPDSLSSALDDGVVKNGGEHSDFDSNKASRKRTNEASSLKSNGGDLEINPFTNIDGLTDSSMFAVRVARSANSNRDRQASLLSRLVRSASSGKMSEQDTAEGHTQSSEENDDYVLEYDTGGRWLADAAYYDYQADAPAEGAPVQTDECPRVPEVLPAGACSVQECKSDRECLASGRQCCYNGCTYTCLVPLQPPAFIDWIREPRRRLKSGMSWLVPGPEELEEVETCSTTPVDEDEDPLLCPHGYVCSIEYPGNPEKNVPNRGRCVREADDSITLPVKESGVTAAPHHRERSHHGCDLGSEVVLKGGQITQDGKTCVCKNRRLKCSTRR